MARAESSHQKTSSAKPNLRNEPCRAIKIQLEPKRANSPLISPLFKVQKILIFREHFLLTVLVVHYLLEDFLKSSADVVVFEIEAKTEDKSNGKGHWNSE